MREIRFVGAIILTLVGCGPDECATCPITSGTIHGRVIDNHGRPVVGASVVVAGQVAVTNREGGFIATSIDSSYDLVYVGTSVIAYRGLTRRKPIIVVTSETTPEHRTTIVSGHVPLYEKEYTSLFFVGPRLTRATGAETRTGAYTLDASWYTSEERHEGALYALRRAPPDGGPTMQYPGLAGRRIRLAAGSRSVVDFGPDDFDRPRVFGIKGRVVHPADYDLNSINLEMEFDGGFVFLNSISYATSPTPDDFEFIAPRIPGASYAVSTSALSSSVPNRLRTSTAWVGGIGSSASDVTVVLYAGPTLLQPADDATDVDLSTRFAWNDSPGPGIYELLVAPLDNWPVRRWREILVYLKDTSAVLPDLASFGLGLASGEKYWWRVSKLHSILTTDEAATENGPGSLSSSWSHAIFTPRQP